MSATRGFPEFHSVVLVFVHYVFTVSGDIYKTSRALLFSQTKLNTYSRYFRLKKLIVISAKHLPDPGRFRRRFLKLDRESDLRLLSAIPPINTNHHVPGLQLWVLGGLRNGQNRLHAGILVGKNVLPFRQGFFCNLFFQNRFQVLLMLRILAHGEAVYLRDPQGVEQAGSELGLETANRKPATVARLVVVVKGAAVQQRAFRLLFLATGEAGRPGHGVQRERGIGHADINKLPFSGLLPVNYRSQDAHHGMVRTTSYIRNLYTHGWRPAVGSAAVAANARQGEIIDVVACTILVGAGLAVTSNGAIDEARVYRLEGFVANAKPVHHPRAKLLNNNVVVFDQFQNFLPATLLFEVEPERLLATIQETVGGA